MTSSSPTSSTPSETSAYGLYAPSALLRLILARTTRLPARWLGRRTAFALRSVAVRFLGGHPLDVVRLGARMRLHPYNNVCEKRILFTPQYFDEAERELLSRYLGPGSVFIDIGANIGGYTLSAAAHSKAGTRILAIEPQPEIFERLIYNVRQNDFPCVKALNCAVADRDGEIILFVSPRNRGETSMRIVSSYATNVQIKVPAKSLVTIVAEEGFTTIDAVKLDVEGAEDVVLEPFLRTAPQALWPRIILMEVSRGQWTIDVPKLLEDCGYREILRTRNNVAYLRGQPAGTA